MAKMYKDFETCLVCGMQMDSPRISKAFQGIKYFFCCPACRRQFEFQPDEYII
jgi:YHS domain-containing protein